MYKIVVTTTNDSRTNREQITNKIKLVFGAPWKWANRWFSWGRMLLSGYAIACFELRFPYEDAGVSRELHFAILEW